MNNLYINYAAAATSAAATTAATTAATSATSNETFSISQTPSLFSSTVEDIEEESPKRKESISGNHITDVNMLLLVTCYVLNEYREQFINSLWKIWEKIRIIIIVIFKILQYIQELFTSAKVERFWD